MIKKGISLPVFLVVILLEAVAIVVVLKFFLNPKSPSSSSNPTASLPTLSNNWKDLSMVDLGDLEAPMQATLSDSDVSFIIHPVLYINLKDSGTIKEILKTAEPMLRDAFLSLMAKVPYPEIRNSSSEREKLRLAMEAVANQILESSNTVQDGGGSKGSAKLVRSVAFTKFTFY